MVFITSIRRATSGLLLPVGIAILLVVVGGPYLRIVALDFGVLGESLRRMAVPPGQYSPENRVQIPYDPDRAPELTKGLHFTYEYCGGEVRYDPPILADAWIGRGDAAIRYGALPLVALSLAAWALRRRARLSPATWTPRRLSRRARGVLAALVLLPFAAFALPLALGLSVWIVVEVFAWIEWFDMLTELTENILVRTVPVLLAGTLLAGVLLVRAALWEGTRAPGERRGWRAWLLWGGVALPITLTALPALAIAAVHAARLAPVATLASDYEHACSTCHSSAAPLALIRSPDTWKASLDATCLDEMPIGQADKDNLVAFVSGMRSFPDAWVFRTRCQRCHGHTTPSWVGRSPDDWRGLLERISRFSPYYYGKAVRTQLYRHLVATWPGDTPEFAGQDGASVRRTIQACTTCHFFSRNLQAYDQVSADGALALVRRMSARMEPPLSEAEVQAAAAIWRAMALEPGALSRLVPHDRPTFAPGSDW